MDAILRFQREVDADVVCLIGNHEDWLLRTLRDHSRHSWLLGMEALDTIQSCSVEAAVALREAMRSAGAALYMERCALPYEAFFDRRDPGMIDKKAWHLALTLAVLSTIGCDRVTKHAAATFLSELPSRSYLADTVRLGYAENAGGFLSLGAELPSAVRTGLFTVGTGLLLCVLVFIAIRRRWDRLSTLGLALFVAGGASNWIDRVTRGSVVDFLNVGVGPVRTGIFNVADVAIMLGAAVIVIAAFGKKPASSPRAHPGDTA